MFRGGSDGIGFTSLNASASPWEFDITPDQNGLDWESGWAVHFVSGPGRTDLPARLYDLFYNVHYNTGDVAGLDISFSPGLYTDFEDSVRQGWRIPGRALGYLEMHSGSQRVGRLVAGFEYLDLVDNQLIPAGGMIIRDDDIHLDLYYPRPQIRIRLNEKEKTSRWIYA